MIEFLVGLPIVLLACGVLYCVVAFVGLMTMDSPTPLRDAIFLVLFGFLVIFLVSVGAFMLFVGTQALGGWILSSVS